MKVNIKVRILKIDMKDPLYCRYPEMKKLKGREGVFTGKSPFRKHCSHVVVGSSLFVFYNTDLKEI